MKRGKLWLGIVGAVLATAGTWLSVVHAADPPAGDFNLQITPSPLVTTVKPGTKTQLELKIRNGGTGTERLKIEPREFTFDSKTGQVNLDNSTPPAIAPWIKFSQAQFTAAPGQWITEQITLDVPANAGFSYSLALVVSRQQDAQPAEGERLIKGSVAVFTLINIDRPDASSSLSVQSFSVSKHMYEYLPATFTIRFRNGGNTIVQPYGNVFIGRDKDAKDVLGSLAVNDTHGYILPDTERTVTANWTNGFPAYHTVQNADGSSSQKLVWDWTKVSSLRIGRYTAHLIAVYNQNGRDVPIEGTVTFWVIPWKILSVLLVIVLLLLFSLFMLVRTIVRSIKRQHAKRISKKATRGADSTE